MPANETHYYGWLVVESIVEVEEHNIIRVQFYSLEHEAEVYTKQHIN